MLLSSPGAFRATLKRFSWHFHGWAAQDSWRERDGAGAGVCSPLPPFLGMQEEQEKSAGALVPEGCSCSFPELEKGRRTLGKCLPHTSAGALPHLETGNGTSLLPVAPSQICSFDSGALFAALSLPSGSNWGAGPGICPEHLPGVFLTCLSSASPEAQGSSCTVPHQVLEFREMKSPAFPFYSPK